MNILTTDEWLAILRIGIGLWWIKSVFHKDLRKFVNGGMVSWTVEIAENHPWRAYGTALKALVTASASWIGYFVVLGELAVGIGLTFGFLTPISALVAIFLNINYILLAGVKLKDPSINPCFRVEQGQNWVMIVAEVVILGTAAWAVWSLDSLLGLS